MQLIVIACFIGILLTASIFYLTNTFITGDIALTPYCYDGGVIEGDDPVNAFNRAIYQNEASLSFIHEQQYTLFGVVIFYNTLNLYLHHLAILINYTISLI